MTHPVTIRPEGQRDIEEAAFWYEIQRPGLGDQFIFQIDSLLQRIEERPLQFPDVGRGVRRGLLHRFPFAVYFVRPQGALSSRSFINIATPMNGNGEPEFVQRIRCGISR